MKNLAFVLLLALVLLTSGCFFPPPPARWTREITAPDGRPAHAIVCGDRVSVCYDRATKVCPDGYKLLSSSGSTGHYTAGAAHYQRRVDMMIRCKTHAEAPTDVADCKISDWCKQLGRCRFDGQKCVR